MRAGQLTVAELIDYYMAHYAGRDESRAQRLRWWIVQIGSFTLDAICDDHIHAALEALAQQRARYWAGTDADGRTIFKAKGKPLSPASLNRYAAAIAAVFTWAIKRRIAPKNWVHPCRGVERRTENNEVVRFLSDDERERIMTAAKECRWPRMYLLVLLALTTGARKSELLGLRWQDVDLSRRIAHLGRSKNGDPKVLPLTDPVVSELERFAGPSGLVFPSRLRPNQPYAFEVRWHEVLRAARIKSFRFHDLRHSCASMLAQSGATLIEIADVLGHRQLAMTKRYSHLTTEHKASLLNRVLGGIK